ncbi:MAG: glycine zipper domain-containing protein [Gemmatimonadales bacterium]
MRIVLISTLALVGGVATHLQAQDSTATAAPAAAAAPAGAAQKGPAASLGLYVFPAKGQTPEQQSQDEQACYAWSKEQSGIDPATVKANPDSAMKAASAKVDTAAQGAAIKGAARGAAGGAVVGAIAGDAGTGAGVGAVVGAASGRKAKKEAKKQAEQQAAQQANAWAAGQIDTFKKAFSACIEGKGYTVK